MQIVTAYFAFKWSAHGVTFDISLPRSTMEPTSAQLHFTSNLLPISRKEILVGNAYFCFFSHWLWAINLVPAVTSYWSLIFNLTRLCRGHTRHCFFFFFYGKEKDREKESKKIGIMTNGEIKSLNFANNIRIYWNLAAYQAARNCFVCFWSRLFLYKYDYFPDTIFTVYKCGNRNCFNEIRIHISRKRDSTRLFTTPLLQRSD